MDVFIDTDFLSSLLWSKRSNLLSKVYPNDSFFIPPFTRSELFDNDANLSEIRNQYHVDIVNGYYSETTDKQADLSTLQLTIKMNTYGVDGFPSVGRGEAQAFAYAVHNKGALASNNLRDIKQYTTRYKIPLITTSDFIFDAYNQSIITETEAEDIWKCLIQHKRIMPNQTFKEYLEDKKNA